MHVVELVTRGLTSNRCNRCSTEGASLCSSCATSLQEAPKSSCIVCNTLTLGGKLCTPCRQKTKLYSLNAAYRYEGDAEKFLRNYKYDGERDLASPLAVSIEDIVPPITYDLLIWVPSSPARVRRRGFDHTKKIGKRLGKSLQIKTIQPISRIGHGRQVGSNRATRFEQVQTQYSIKPHVVPKLKNKHILLVDDVATTGATITYCARLLRNAGAKRVDAVVFARR